MWKEHLSEYYAPKNFNFWYFMGGFALLVLVILVVVFGCLGLLAELRGEIGDRPSALAYLETHYSLM